MRSSHAGFFKLGQRPELSERPCSYLLRPRRIHWREPCRPDLLLPPIGWFRSRRLGIVPRLIKLKGLRRSPSVPYRTGKQYLKGFRLCVRTKDTADPSARQGPEGRPLNVSPARKGWVSIQRGMLSARGAAPCVPRDPECDWTRRVPHLRCSSSHGHYPQPLRAG